MFFVFKLFFALTSTFLHSQSSPSHQLQQLSGEKEGGGGGGVLIDLEGGVQLNSHLADINSEGKRTVRGR